MGATTRASTGNSKPRVVQEVEDIVVAPKKRSSTGTKSAATKANTSKPRTSKVTAGRVAKAKTTPTKTAPTKKSPGANVKTVKKPRTKTEKVVDKVEGKTEELIGEVTGKPGKKAAGSAKANGADAPTKRAAPRTRKAA